MGAYPTYNQTDLINCLEALGVASGQTVMVHSSLMSLGLMSDCAINDIPKNIFEILKDQLGTQGTLCVPGSYWEYGQEGSDAFDVINSPVSKGLGAFPRYMLGHEGSMRSPNPIFSIIAYGPNADHLTQGVTAHSFGYDSAWDRLFKSDAQMLFLGCDLSYMSLVRYIEFHFGVPYLYHKLFHKPIIQGGEVLFDECVALVRYMHCPVEYDLSNFQKLLEEQGVLKSFAIGHTNSYFLNMKACFDIGMEALRNDLYFFLKSPPTYQEGQVPVR